MLICKDVKTITNKDGSYVAIPYDRAWLQFDATDKIVALTKTVKGKAVEVNGVVYAGTKPEQNVTAVSNDTQKVFDLLNAATEHCESLYGSSDTYKSLPKETRGTLILLDIAEGGLNILTCSALDAQYRPKAEESPEVVEAKAVKAIIADGARRGKVISEEKAKAIRTRQLELEAEMLA